MPKWANGETRYAGVPHPRTQRRRILAAWQSATHEERIQGKEWYPTVYEWCAENARSLDVPTVNLAGAFAWMSPGVDTNKCYSMTLDLASAWERGIYDTPLKIHAYGGYFEAMALDCLDGYLDSLRITPDVKSYKVRSFFANIIGDDEKVTVDRWAARIAGCEKDLLSGGAYIQVADNYRKVAEKLGMPAYELQAVTWITMRGKASLESVHQMSFGFRWDIFDRE